MSAAREISPVVAEFFDSDQERRVDNTAYRAFIEPREQRDSRLSMPRCILSSVHRNIGAHGLPDSEVSGYSYLKTPINAFAN